MLGTTFKSSNEGDTTVSFSFKRPKLLSHQFSLQRQQILLLNTRSTSSAASILSEQDRKLEQLDDFICKLSESSEILFNNRNNSINSQLQTEKEKEKEKEIWCGLVLEGLEMFLRALKSILSNFSHKLGLKILKFKLKLLTCQTLNHELRIEECFEECLKMNGKTKEIEIDIFEEYFGMNPILDTLIGTKIMEFMFKKNLKEKLKFCLEFQKKRTTTQAGGQENIQRELIKNVFEGVKNNFDAAQNNFSNNLHWEVMLNLLEILMNSTCLDINQMIDYCLIIFQGNRFEFLNNVNVFDKFLRFLNTPRIRNCQSFGSVVVTSFNSRIRSFLGKTEAKNENVVVSCTKFVLEFFTIGIGCIEQFAEFLLKCQLIPINSIKNSQNRNLIYKLFKVYTKKTKSSLLDKPVNLFYENLNNELKMEFATNLIVNNSIIKGDYILLNCSTEYLNEIYMKIVDKIISRHINVKEEDVDVDVDMMMVCIDDEELFKNENDNENEIIVGELEYVLNFCKDNLLPIYLKTFKTNHYTSTDKLFLKTLSKISGLLLDNGRISWTDLTGVLGPSVGSNNSLRPEGRAGFCFVYSQWLKFEFKSFQVKTLLKNVLNPKNSAELWARSLFDFEDYGQVEFINLYFNSSSTSTSSNDFNHLSSRVDCFKKLELPTKFMLEMMMKSIDFRSCHNSIDLSFWNYLIEFGEFLIKSKSSLNLNLKGIICALLTKYLPVNDLKLIMKFYEMYWQDVDEVNFEMELKVPGKDLIIGFIRNDPCIKKSHEFIKSLLKGEGFKRREVFLDIFNEFMRVIIDVDINVKVTLIEREVFLVQLALASGVPFIFTDQMDRNFISDFLLTSLTTKTTSTNLKLVYLKLFLLCELKLSFDYCYCRVNVLLIELCNLCGKDLEGFEEFLFENHDDYVCVNKRIKNQTKIIKGLQREIPFERIHLKNSNPIILTFNNDERISPIDCLILLLKLLEGDGTDRLYNLKMFIKKKKRITCKDIYNESKSNLLFNLYFN